MFKVNHLTRLKPKKMKKGGKFDQGCKKNRYFLQPSFAF